MYLMTQVFSVGRDRQIDFHSIDYLIHSLIIAAGRIGTGHQAGADLQFDLKSSLYKYKMMWDTNSYIFSDYNDMIRLFLVVVAVDEYRLL